MNSPSEVLQLNYPAVEDPLTPSRRQDPVLDVLNNFMEQKLISIASLVADKKRLDARIEGVKEETEKERTQLKEVDQKNAALSGELMRT